MQSLLCVRSGRCHRNGNVTLGPRAGQAEFAVPPETPWVARERPRPPSLRGGGAPGRSGGAKPRLYFTAWKESAAAISDPDLRKRSEQRLADARARFDKIAVAGKDTRQSFDSLMTDVKDQSTFLGHDLNASAIASLKPNAAKFNAHATTVFTKVDGVSKMFDEYIASLKP
jgi:hypothetical protein